MKYKIEELKDMTDSREMMELSPKGFSRYMTYIIILLLTSILIWSLFAYKEISINASGIVRPAGDVNKVSSILSGNISEINVKDGDSVKKGDTLMVINAQLDAVSIKASKDGVISMTSQLNIGDFVQSGMEIASIIPQDEDEFKVDVYINNKDFGNIKDGQEVMIEIASLPSSEYGYIKSNLQDISTDAKSGKDTSYYTAVCSIEETSLSTKKGESADIKNGMIANVRIINRKVTYFRYFLEMMGI